MKIKTFQALTMQDALKAIKAELGPEAVIISTKQVSQGTSRFGLLSRTMVEVTAAVDVEPARPARGRVDQPARVQDERPSFDQVLRASLHTKTGPAPGKRSSPAEVQAEEGRGWADVLEELKQIRECLGVTTAETRRPVAPKGEADIAPLVRIGLDPATAEGLIHDAAERWGRAREQSCDEWRRCLVQAIAARVKTSGPVLSPDERRKIVILVGPTGVGKTTTIAKLAAHYRLQEHRSVALITLDTYRLAAVEQLRTYANLIGVGLDVALTRREALESMARRRDAELILIDTAGRSPRDASGLAELRELISFDAPLEVHLVVSATTRERDLLENMGRYRQLPISRLLVTKMDETGCFGGIVELIRQTGLPVSYLSRGQRVPEDLEAAQPETLADLVLTGVELNMPALAPAQAS
ncbi:flagellar biosynthesis protein FlhF [Candidatus Nitrospira bockiana]